MEKRKFGGAQIGAGRKKKPEGQAQKTITFGAAKDCEVRLDAHCSAHPINAKPRSKGKIICAALELADRHPEEFRDLLEQRDTPSS